MNSVSGGVVMGPVQSDHMQNSICHCAYVEFLILWLFFGVSKIGRTADQIFET